MFELEEYTLFKLKLKQICSMQLSSTFASACYKIFTYHTLGSEKSDKHQVWLCEAFIQRARKCMSNEWHDPSKGSTKAIVAKSSPNFPPSTDLISWELNHSASLSSGAEMIKSPPWPIVSHGVHYPPRSRCIFHAFLTHFPTYCLPIQRGHETNFSCGKSCVLSGI